MAAQETRGGVIEHRIGTNGLFAIATSSGGIDLRGGDGEVVRISTVDPDDAPLLDRFEVETSEGLLRVRSPRGVFLGLDVFGRRFGWGGGVGELDLVVEMPRSARLELATVSGDVHVAGLRGQQRYKSVSGDLELEDAAGQVEVDATSGDVSLQAAAPVALRLRTVSGDVSAKAPHIRRLDATTMSGDIRVEGAFEAGQEHSVETVSGDTRLVDRVGPDHRGAHRLRWHLQRHAPSHGRRTRPPRHHPRRRQGAPRLPLALRRPPDPRPWRRHRHARGRGVARSGRTPRVAGPASGRAWHAGPA